MAYREVELTEEEKASLGGSFFKFNAIGDKFAGRFVATRPGSGQYGQGKTDYVFRARKADGTVGDVVITPAMDLAQKLRKADLKPGYAVMITYASNVDVGKESPMKVFKVLVDDSPAPAAKPKPPPPPEDDIGF